jgi:hypothetical protein
MWYRFMLIYINLNFDFLGLDNVYFENYFANELIRWVVFYVVYNIRVRVVSDIQTLAFGSSLYIRYNTAAHVVNST